MTAEPIYLRSFLSPLVDVLARPDVTDVYINRPGELWIETLAGVTERQDAPTVDAVRLERLARQIASLSSQGISREHPILSASLPDGARIQIVAPPATRGTIGIAIRKHVTQGLTLDDYVATGAFFETRKRDDGEVRAKLATLLEAQDFAGLLRTAVCARRNILVSGGTSTGKTTFLNSLLAEIPKTERIVLIEDTPELKIPQPNSLGLLAARSALGEASVTAEDLLTASLRMRPDRIILGELRGAEAFSFLRAVNTGHPGSMTTIHADSPAGAVEQLALLVLQSGARLTHADVVRYVRNTIDVFVQLDRSGGRRFVSEVALKSDR